MKPILSLNHLMASFFASFLKLALSEGTTFVGNFSLNFRKQQNMHPKVTLDINLLNNFNTLLLPEH